MTLSVLLLAAGQGRRFGHEPKQLAQYCGAPLLTYSLALAEASAPGRVVLVLGAHAEKIVQRLTLSDYIVHPEWALGLGASIAFGVQHLPPNTDAVLILLADQIALTQEDVFNLRRCYEQQLEEKMAENSTAQKKIVCAQYHDQLGVPAIFPRHFFSLLAGLSGDKGAKKILLSETVLRVSLPNAAIDIDTPEDLRQFTESKEPSCLN